jgi:hypothetical protein
MASYFGPLTLRRKESSAKLKAKSRKDKRGYLCRLPGFKMQNARKAIRIFQGKIYHGPE